MTTLSRMTLEPATGARWCLGVAWAVILLTSALPLILFNELGDGAPAWLPWAQIGLLTAVLALSLVWAPLRPLRAVALVLLALLAGLWLVDQLGVAGRVQALFPAGTAPFTRQFLGEQGGRLALTLLMIAALWLIFGDRRAFFLSAGDLNATAAPIRWLGITEPVAWSRLAPIAGVLISLGTLLFVWLGARPTGAQFRGALPLLPAVLLIAALNAFHETIVYRASLLAGLEPAVGAAAALLMAALWFGAGHYYGVPNGVIGVVMAGFLGWFLGRSVLETRGIVWAWGIHWLQDVVIFFFLAMGTLRPGG
jgi:hypothetical protein